LCRAQGIRAIVGSYVVLTITRHLRNRKLYEGCGLKRDVSTLWRASLAFRFVDFDGTIAKDRDHFVDAVHFNPAEWNLSPRALPTSWSTRWCSHAVRSRRHMKGGVLVQ